MSISIDVMAYKSPKLRIFIFYFYSFLLKQKQIRYHNDSIINYNVSYDTNYKNN